MSESMMTALVRRGSTVGLERRVVPQPGQDEVLVAVAAAGLCRTDLAVARRGLAGPDPIVLGHEFSGTVHAVGPGVRRLEPGEPVGVMPVVPCGVCPTCRDGFGSACPRRHFIGVDGDGAFASYVCVPRRAVFPIPRCISFDLAVLLEPITAVLAVTEVGLDPRSRGLVHGTNRIAELTARVLRARGFTQVDVGSVGAGGYDWAVETFPTGLGQVVDAVRPRGTVVLKSRCPDPVPFPLGVAVAKELTLRCAHYGRFQDAIDLLAHGAVSFEDLLAPARPLADFEAVFRSATSDEATKPLFRVGSHVRDR